MRVRLAVLVVCATIAAACATTVPVPTPTTTAWGPRVATAAPDAAAAQEVVARGTDTITLLPISPAGAAVGIAYAYNMPHCGIAGPIDVNGSFWDAVGVDPASVDFDGQPGFFRLSSPTAATFTTATGDLLRLVRHDGAKQFRLCS
jgi:hypothetical protein